MDKKTLLFSIIIGILFPLIILISAVETASFDKAFFMRQVEENEVVKNTGIVQPDMESVVNEILSYLRGERADFDIKARTDQSGKPVSIFNEQEMVHMDDVRDLLNQALALRNLGIILFLIAFLCLLKWDPMAIIKGLFYGSVISLVIILGIGLLFATRFDQTFTLFHQLFFSNDLWIMNPKTDLLIWIVPGPFFFNLITRMVMYAVASLSITSIGTGIVLYKNRNSNINRG